MGRSKTRLFAWSTITAKFVNWSMATPKVGDPGMPSVCRVLKGLESVSTMETVLLAELDVRIAPVCELTAREVGLIPTLTELCPPSGLNSKIALVPLELAKKTPGFVVFVATAGSKTIPVGVLETKPEETVVLRAGGLTPISTTSKAPEGAEPLLNATEVTTAMPWLLMPRSGSMATAMGC